MQMSSHFPYSSVCSNPFSHLYNLYPYFILQLIVSLVSLLSPAPQIRPRSSSRLRGVSIRTTCSIQLSDWRLSPPTLPLSASRQAFFFLYSALPAFIGGSASGGTYNFFSWGAVSATVNACVYCTSQTPPLYYETAHLADQTRQSCDQLFLNARISALAT